MRLNDNIQNHRKKNCKDKDFNTKKNSKGINGFGGVNEGNVLSLKIGYSTNNIPNFFLNGLISEPLYIY